jgi:hypothetical protein
MQRNEKKNIFVGRRLLQLEKKELYKSEEKNCSQNNIGKLGGTLKILQGIVFKQK